MLKVSSKKERLNDVVTRMTQASSAVDNAAEDLKSLLIIAEQLTAKANALNENATILREANVQVLFHIISYFFFNFYYLELQSSGFISLFCSII